MLKRWWWILLVMLAVGPAAGLLVGAAVTYVMPKKYESVATVEFRDPDGVERHVAVLKGDGFLRQLAADLELHRKWGVELEDAVGILRRVVSVEAIRGTDLVAVRVRHTSPGDAQEIAARIPRIYGRQLVVDFENDLERQRSELFDQVRAQEQKMERLEERLGGTDDGAVSEQLSVERRTLLEVKLTDIGEMMGPRLPYEPLVVIEEPVEARIPFSPNIPLNLALGTGSGLLLAVPLGFLLMALLQRMIPPKHRAPPPLPAV